MEEDKISVKEFEDLFGNTPFENIKKIRKYINENYIPKSKVKEKIEELKKQEDFYREHDRMYEHDGKISLLKSLLED